jgi:uncharacterized protein YegP (UPF0339 family)
MPRGERFEVYRDQAGEYRWRLRDGNHRITANSGESFHDQRGAMEAALQVRSDLNVWTEKGPAPDDDLGKDADVVD